MGLEVLAAMAIGGKLISGISQLNAGIAANKAAKAQAAQYEAQGKQNARNKRREGVLFMSKQRASLGASGAGLMGNALDLIEMTAVENELEAQSILTNSRFEAYNSLVQGKMAASQGRAAVYSSFGEAAGMAMIGMSGSSSSGVRIPEGVKKGTLRPTYNPSSSYRSGY